MTQLLRDVYRVHGKLVALQDRVHIARLDEVSLVGQIAKLDRDVEIVTLAIDLMRSLTFEHADRVRQFVANLVSAGVQDVFDADWTVDFIEETKAGSKSLDIVLRQGNITAAVPDGVGGGVAQVIAVLIQIAMVYLLRSQVAQVIFLDESLSHLARAYQPAAARVLKQVSKDLGIQIVLIAHSDELVKEADIAYEFALHEGNTRVRRLSKS